MDKYISIQELADLKGVSTRTIRMSRDKYVTREITVRGGKSFEILLSSIEPELEEKYLNQKIQITSDSTALIPMTQSKNLPTKVNEIALARLDLSEIRVYTTKNQFICVAKRVTGTHPMAYHIGTIRDIEDFKQKIRKY